ncbi:MAG: hypothetical protein A2622_03270 [Bdellovibrionales bacterium RIFCSPHIGHO2_01_FULL_40_29]|nr:MAG: hypothetical protein A2622_03270 [Bdellovibrionales bacterium RIFCSPHIGHO2_01_FULL_40_29]OFZ34147.1 MAG: hypothetical protein A3D17_03690 [Bdellovibrionales bacterium RIFCSPHIGHO2_02_FULL_40_15]
MFDKETSVKAVQYYEKASSIHQKAYIQLQCHCVLCNTTLELQFEVVTTDEIKEVAHCPQCEIRTRAKTHHIQ